MHTFIKNLLNGQAVEWRTVDEIFDIRNGYTPSKRNKEYWENGTVPWFRMEDIRENGRILNSALQQVSQKAVKGERLFPANSIIISISATIGEHALITVPYLANQRFTNLALKAEYKNKFNHLFLYYYCFNLCEWCKNNTTISSFASVDMNGFRKFKIPIPPLSVQSQIVQILDTFTELTDQLRDELTAELSMRQKQYQYYRDFLLSEHELAKVGFEWKTLGEVAKIKHGKDWKKLAIGDIPVYGSGGIMGYVDTFSYDKPSVLIPRKGSITNLFYVETPFWNVDTIYYTKIDTNQILPKFLYYFIKTIDLMQLDTGSGRPSLTQAILNKIQIPIPPLSVQSEIVAILDTFDTLTQSISEGLPKEIKLRQTQYEYYRERLLNFDAGDAS